MARPPIARLDRSIDIQTPTGTRDAAGQPVASWADFEAGVPAEYLPVGGAEQFEAQQRLGAATARFRIRYRTDLTRKMRIVFESGEWDIRHFEEDRRFDRRQYLLVTAELVGAP